MSDSIWKKEISFRRKHDGDEAPPAEGAPAYLEKQLAFQRRLEEAAAAAGRPAPAPSPVAAPPVERYPDLAPAATSEAEVVEAPVEGEQSIWRKEITFRRKPRAEAPAASGGDEPRQPPTVAPAPAPEQSIWKKEITFRRKPEAERSDSVWNKEISLRRRAARQQQIQRLADEALRQVEAGIEPEPWLAAPQLPPEPDEETPTVVSMPAPAPAVAAAPSAPQQPAPAEQPKQAKKAKKEKAAKAPKPKRERRLSLPALPKPAPRGGGGGGSHQVKKLVGLKIGASQLAAARVANNGAAELMQLAREPLEQGVVVGGEVRDPEALANALRQFFARNKLPKKNVRLGIASNRIGVRIFDLAGIADEKQLENAIRFRAQEALPIPLDEAVLDYHVLGDVTDEDGVAAQRVLLVVAYRELVERYVSACRKAGITLAGVDLEAFALLRALAAPRTPDAQVDAALVAVAIGHDRSTFAVSDGRVCEFTRVIEWGGSTLNVAIARALDLAPSEVEHVKRVVSLDSQDVPEGMAPEQYALAVDAVRKQVQAFARELVSSLQFYQHQPGSLGIGEIVITGGSAGLAGIAGELERLIGVRVRVGDPLARMKVPKKLPLEDNVGSLAIAIGLGIED